MADLPASTRSVAVAPGQRVTVDGRWTADVVAVAVESPLGGDLNHGATWFLVIPGNAAARQHTGTDSPQWVARVRVDRMSIKA